MSTAGQVKYFLLLDVKEITVCLTFFCSLRLLSVALPLPGKRESLSVSISISHAGIFSMYD